MNIDELQGEINDAKGRQEDKEKNGDTLNRGQRIDYPVSLIGIENDLDMSRSIKCLKNYYEIIELHEESSKEFHFIVRQIQVLEELIEQYREK